MELSLRELGADEPEAEQITAALTRIIAKAMMNDPARAARSIGALTAILNETIRQLHSQQSWAAERALQATLDDGDD